MEGPMASVYKEGGDRKRRVGGSSVVGPPFYEYRSYIWVLVTGTVLQTDSVEQSLSQLAALFEKPQRAAYF